jgi:hypothetical protein
LYATSSDGNAVKKCATIVNAYREKLKKSFDRVSGKFLMSYNDFDNDIVDLVI